MGAVRRALVGTFRGIIRLYFRRIERVGEADDRAAYQMHPDDEGHRRPEDGDDRGESGPGHRLDPARHHPAQECFHGADPSAVFSRSDPQARRRSGRGPAAGYSWASL
jgi:hypothetical protein